MKLTLKEMNGLLNGKCLPSDLIVGETLAEYLVRKFTELEQQLAESRREFRAADATIENLQMQVEKLAAESEERRQFILNGVEFGYIRLPDEDTADSAKAIYERCLSAGKYTPCQKCNDTGMTDSGGAQPWGEPIEIECDCGAAQLRKGV